MWGHYWWAGAGWIHFIWIGIGITLIFMAYRLLKNILQNRTTESAAISILQERLAKGEITEEEFNRMKRLLYN